MFSYPGARISLMNIVLFHENRIQEISIVHVLSAEKNKSETKGKCISVWQHFVLIYIHREQIKIRTGPLK